jgi:hypothetical protein
MTTKTAQELMKEFGYDSILDFKKATTSLINASRSRINYWRIDINHHNIKINKLKKLIDDENIELKEFNEQLLTIKKELEEQ